MLTYFIIYENRQQCVTEWKGGHFGMRGYERLNSVLLPEVRGPGADRIGSAPAPGKKGGSMLLRLHTLKFVL